METPKEVLAVQGFRETHTNANDDQPSEAATSNITTLDTLQTHDQRTLMTRPFQSVLNTLDKLEREDPKLASQAARLVGLFRRLWESCVTKHVDAQALEDTNQALRADNVQLRQEEGRLKKREEDQTTRLASFHEGMEHAREQMLEALKNWNMYVSDDVTLPSQEMTANA
ncbi:hypothetical protein POX_f07415 [Penicillium oxalicum]|uniref:hypothetical protein n=1 Tax=Penicillium oxalicum TaxID=69781 RepID=UPI0020B757F9|nr:hypothetical protein POX_f07415 [Penicillium oxalicum]KAI2787060.1 hypothetical protein POX_f07415 [Penicillium oxalicum]